MFVREIYVTMYVIILLSSFNVSYSTISLMYQCVVPENIHNPLSHGRDFTYDPLASGFSKIGSQNGSPLPSGNCIFLANPLEILSFLVETKNKLFS